MIKAIYKKDSETFCFIGKDEGATNSSLSELVRVIAFANALVAAAFPGDLKEHYNNAIEEFMNHSCDKLNRINTIYEKNKHNILFNKNSLLEGVAQIADNAIRKDSTMTDEQIEKVYTSLSEIFNLSVDEIKLNRPVSYNDLFEEESF